jgi:pimeloyl-ACP methyl ester carboxylesterase
MLPPDAGAFDVIGAVGGSGQWEAFNDYARKLGEHFHHEYQLRHFEYIHPVRLQKSVPMRLRKPYPVRVAYTEWGPEDAPLVLCCGGIANSAVRFSFLASDLQDRFRVICMDWLGRGLSGWMADECEYSLPTFVEQTRQMILHLGGKPVTIIGSSFGGSVGIELAARYPRLISQLILNDIGPYIPAKRRRRRAETLARFYVFRDPTELARRVGAAHKNDGPISDDIRFYIAFAQTRWSSENGGRVYRYDIRVMQAYRRDAQTSLDQWAHWERVRCPIFLIHGLQSDALMPETIDRMRVTHSFHVMHVPDTGHTPVLSDHNQTWCIRNWLSRTGVIEGDWTVLHEYRL